ncbi:MAG: protein-methionine-sulfoxide reductase catalytic subunit MsrP, partial [Vicinamibacterales bacterium]
MLIRTGGEIPSSEITDERWYLRRREFIQLGVGAIGAVAGGALAACGRSAVDAAEPGAVVTTPQSAIANIKKRMVTTSDPENTYEQITTYNNFYEFGTNKGDPARYA